MNIKQAASYTGLDQMWIRRMILEGKLPAVKETVPGTAIPRWDIDKADLDAHMASAKHTRREDGRNKFVAYADMDELAKANEALKAAGLDIRLERANTPEQTAKRYQAQKVRKAAAKARKSADLDALKDSLS